MVSTAYCFFLYLSIRLAPRVVAGITACVPCGGLLYFSTKFLNNELPIAVENAFFYSSGDLSISSDSTMIFAADVAYLVSLELFEFTLEVSPETDVF